MDILSYLNALIKTRKAVGLPGLGSFYKKKSPGRYDADSHSFLPPSYVLEYTTEIKEYSLLRDFISKTAQIDPDTAVYYIDRFTTEIRQKLDIGEDVKLSEIGTLKKGPDGYIFIPDNRSNMGFDFYGMPGLAEIEPQPVQDDQPVYEEISEVPITEKVTQPIVIETTEGQVENEPELPIANSDQPIKEHIQVVQPEVRQPLAEYNYEVERAREEPKGMPAYLIVIIVGAIIFAALIAAYYIKPELFDRSASSNMAANNTVLPTPDTVRADTASSDSLQTDTAVKVATELDTVPAALTTSQADTLISYEIIAASLLNKKEADGFLKQMERKGIPAKIADMPGRRIKVSIGTFTDEQEANTQLQLLKQTTKIPGIYIYTKRHTNNIK